MSEIIPCKFCGHQGTEVVHGLPTTDKQGNPRGYRRRQCLGCGRRFTTYEVYAERETNRFDKKNVYQCRKVRRETKERMSD